MTETSDRQFIIDSTDWDTEFQKRYGIHPKRSYLRNVTDIDADLAIIDSVIAQGKEKALAIAANHWTYDITRDEALIIRYKLGDIKIKEYSSECKTIDRHKALLSDWRVSNHPITPSGFMGFPFDLTIGTNNVDAIDPINEVTFTGFSGDRIAYGKCNLSRSFKGLPCSTSISFNGATIGLISYPSMLEGSAFIFKLGSNGRIYTGTENHPMLLDGDIDLEQFQWVEAKWE